MHRIIPRSTKIEFWRRDENNRKVLESVIVDGLVTTGQINMILDSCTHREFFIPEKVGLPCNRFEGYDPTTNIPFCELTPGCFSTTVEDATVNLDIRTLVGRFKTLKGQLA